MMIKSQTELTDRQINILKFIVKHINTHGYPPSVREIGEEVGLSSSSTVHAHLEKLEKLQFIRRGNKARALEVLDKGKQKLWSESGIDYQNGDIKIPIVGEITAGNPILAEENIDGYLTVPGDYFNNRNDLFVLKVKGNSMIGAGIYDGDLVFIRKVNTADNGDIVVALIDDEATVKRFYKDNNSNNVQLRPENPSYDTIVTNEVQILGIVVGIFRSLET